MAGKRLVAGRSVPLSHACASPFLVGKLRRAHL